MTDVKTSKFSESEADSVLYKGMVHSFTGQHNGIMRSIAYDGDITEWTSHHGKQMGLARSIHEDLVKVILYKEN